MNIHTRIAVRFLLQIALLFCFMVVIGLATGGVLIYETSIAQSPVQMDRLLKSMPANTVFIGRRTHVKPPILRELTATGDWMQILDREGREIFNFHRPQDVPQQYAPGELVIYHDSVSPFGYRLHTWYGTVNGQVLTWVVGAPAEEKATRTHVPIEMTILTVSILIAVVSVSILFGRQLGGPLLHMMEWLQAIARGSLEEPNGRSGQPRSLSYPGGPLRSNYRLYQGVIQALQQLTDTLRRNEQERKNLEQSREEWIAGLSHDLRTPLSSVKGYGELLAAPRYVWSAKEIRDFGTVIVEKSKYIEGLIDDLGLTSNLNQGMFPIRTEPRDIVELTRRTVIDIVNEPGSEGYDVTFQCYETTPFLYPVDEKLFMRALRNLLVNAITHNPQGTRLKVHVELAGSQDSVRSHIMIHISDNGTGMDETTLNRLFDRYYRGTNTDIGDRGGTGLGAAIAKQLIEVHGGSITAHSQPGHGTNIYIVLPGSAGEN